MSNSARHWWGVLIGLILAPGIAAALAYATWRTLSGVAQFGSASTEYKIGLASSALTAVVLGIAVGSRLSPLASLIPGVALTALGGVWAASPQWALQHTSGKLPDSLDKLNSGYLIVGGNGVLLMIGLVLLVASLFPARWRAREDLHPSFDYDAQPPMTEPLPYEHTPQYTRPMGEEVPPPYGSRPPVEEQPGFNTAPDWGMPRRDPNQM